MSQAPAPAAGPWSTTNRDNRNSNQMDGTLSLAYTPLWFDADTSFGYGKKLLISTELQAIYRLDISCRDWVASRSLPSQFKWASTSNPPRI